MDEWLNALKSEMLVKIEKVGNELKLVAEGVGDLVTKSDTNLKAHQRFDETIKHHDLRLGALEHRGTRKTTKRPPRSGPALVNRKMTRNKPR